MSVFYIAEKIYGVELGRTCVVWGKNMHDLLVIHESLLLYA